MTQRRRRAVPTPRQPEYMRRLRLAQGMPRRNKKKTNMSQRLVDTAAKYLLTIPSPTTAMNIISKIALQHHPYDAQRIAVAIRVAYMASPNDHPVQWVILRTNRVTVAIVAYWESSRHWHDNF